MASITLSNAPLTYLENGAATALDAAATFAKTGLASLAGYEIVVTTASGGLPSDRITLANAFNFGANALELDGRKIVHDNIVVGTFTGGVGVNAPLVIQLNSDANEFSVESILRSLQYENFSDNLAATGDRQLEVSLSQAGQAPVATATRTLTVNGVADAPRLYSTQILYDAQTNLLPTDPAASPDGPWLTYQDLIAIPSDIPLVGGLPLLGGTASIAQAPGAAILTSDADAQAGLTNYDFNFSTQTLEPFNNAFPTLDRNAGYVLSFVASVQEESRFNGADNDGDGIDDQAGFNAILLGEDQKGIELGFWEDLIWAQNDGSSQSNPSLEPDTTPADPTRTLFTQGESVAFDTTQTYQYEIVVQGDSYQLLADSMPILSGPLRDYSAFIGRTVSLPLLGNFAIPDPYEQSNFVFLGDNTLAASATVNLGSVSISTSDDSPEVTVANGQIQTFKGFNIQLPDALEETVTVTLTDRFGEGTFAAVSDGTVAVVSASLPDGSSRLQLEGPLSAINAYLADPAQLAYQPAPNFNGTVPLEVAFDVPFNLQSSAISSDFNLDGLSDLLLRNAVSGDNLVRFMDGVSTIGDGVIGRQIPDVNWRFDALGDFNSDQKADIVLRNYNGSGQILLWTMDGANILSETLVGRLVPDPNWEVSGTGDFNSDGQTDIVLRNNVADQNLIWYMNGTDILSEGLVGRAIGDPFWRISGTGDFNGDGQTDIVLRHQSPTGLGQNLVWLMDGSTIQQEVLIGRDVPDIDWEIAGSTDFNSDGQSDLLLRNYRTGDNLAWIMNGTSIAQEVPLLSIPDTQWQALV